jgi:hypothetical protein
VDSLTPSGVATFTSVNVDLVGASNRNSPSHACGSASGKHVEPDADKYGYVHGHHDRRVRRLLALASSSFFFQGPQRLDGTVWRRASMSSPPTEPTRPPRTHQLNQRPTRTRLTQCPRVLIRVRTAWLTLSEQRTRPTQTQA